MRSLFTLVFFLNTLLLSAQPGTPKAGQKESCAWLETIVKAAISGYVSEKGALLRTYQEDYGMGGVHNVEVYNSAFLWPGTMPGLLEISTTGLEDEQLVSLVSRFEKVDTKEKAYIQLKKFYAELVPCVITPLVAQRARTKGTILPLAKAGTLTGMHILDTLYNLNGVKRRIQVTLGIKEDAKKYFAEMRVSLVLRGEEVIVSKCDAVTDAVSKLAVKFSGMYDQVLFSEDVPIANGVSNATVRYKSKVRFPGSDGAWIENHRIKKNGVTRRDSWAMKSWYGSSSYEIALARYKKLYKQLSGCSAVTPAGRRVQLTGTYSEPATMLSGSKRGIIDFKTSTDTDQFFIGITLEKLDNGYFVWLAFTSATK